MTMKSTKIDSTHNIDFIVIRIITDPYFTDLVTSIYKYIRKYFILHKSSHLSSKLFPLKASINKKFLWKMSKIFV